MIRRNFLRRSAACVAALCLLTAARGCCTDPTPGDPLASGDHDLTLDHDGQTREYKLHVPPQYDRCARLPLVFMLHGGFGSSENAAEDYGWNEKADAEGFFVCYPDGTGTIQTWNAMHCCGYARRNDVDDVGFIAALIDEVTRFARIDSHRIYATGMSNGAMLSHRLGAERPDLFAAIAPVAGAVGGQENTDAPFVFPPNPASPVPIIIFHGTADTHVLYDGGETQAGVGDRVDVSVAESADFWVQANGCDSIPTRTISGNIIRDRWAGCDASADDGDEFDVGRRIAASPSVSDDVAAGCAGGN